MQTSFLEKLASHCAIEDINEVLCAHLHFDHIGRNTQYIDGKRIPTFPNAIYNICKHEYSYWKDISEGEIDDDHRGFANCIKPLVDADQLALISEGDRICDGVTTFPTPGHTPCHISVLIESQGQKAVITGDAFHHPCQIGEPDRHTLADTFPEQGIKTRKKLIQNYKEKDVLVLGSHFAAPSGGYIAQKENGYYFFPL